MKKFFNWVLVLGACVGAFYGIGLIVPRSLTQGSKTTLMATPRQVFQVISDASTWSNWNPEVASIQERSGRGDTKTWVVTDKQARTYEMEVTQEEGASNIWQGSYTVDGTHYALHFDMGWYGQGSRVRVSKTTDTKDTWQRARRFLLPTKEASAIELLNALAGQLGESPEAKEN